MIMKEHDVLGGKHHAPLRRWIQVEEEYEDLLPAYPGTLVPAHIPQPPVVLPTTAKADAVRFVARSYRHALNAVYGDPGGILIEAMRGDKAAVLQSKHAHAIVSALPRLIEYKIPPASWTAFSAMVWQKYVIEGQGRTAWNVIPSKRRRPRVGTPPLPGWVFSSKRLAERTDWFAWHEATCRGGKLMISAAHKKLITRYERLRAALLCAPVLSHDIVRDLVCAEYPLRDYAAAMKRIQDDYTFEQDQLTADVRAGKWLW
jgi:hypothetical protein